MAEPGTELKRTPLHDLHVELGGRMVAFAGWSMPVQFPAGIMAEHQHCRTRAALFDVAHMGQVTLTGRHPAAAMEALVPGDIQGLAPGRARYTVLTDDEGGIIDDLIVTNAVDHLFVVVNAGGREVDLAHMADRLGSGHDVRLREDRALLALQGPAAAGLLARLTPEAASLAFMSSVMTSVAGIEARVSRLGYTGEDGFEIAVPEAQADPLARRLLAEPEVAPAGLGARDSLRLEAGLCLYGHDIDRATSPIEAGLGWTIGKRRRAEGGFPGAARILREIADGPARRLVGIRPEGRAPAREGTTILDGSGREVGKVTSGGFGPSLGAPLAMGYVTAEAAAPGTALRLIVRGKELPALVAALPFVPHRYKR